MTKMSSSRAFGFAASGTMNETVANIYDQQMKTVYSQFGNLTGWLGEALDTAREKHDYYMRSRMWEFGKKIKNGEGTFVGRYEIGYLSGLESQRDAEGFMRDIILANPNAMKLYQEGRIGGYDGDLDRLNFGLERENFYYNKVMDGHLTKEEDRYQHTHFVSTRDKGTHYSARERHDSQRTWRATNAHLAAGYDPTSRGIGDNGGKVLTVEQGLARLKAMNEKGNEND